MEERGWAHVATCFTLSGPLKQFLEVYRLQDGQTMLPTLEELTRDPNHRDLMQACTSRQMELTQGLPYDPGAGGPGGPKVNYPRSYFLQAILTLKPDRLPRFIDTMHHVREFFFKNEWVLVSASQSLTAPIRIAHLWRFGNCNELGTLMRLLSTKTEYAALDECCTGQWQQLMYELEPAKS
ncbi:hypothetical protein D7V88_14380 [Corallococcus terminator]|uniref:Uncharacterized protein n=1 Tax=Corallococcus terminator TaxID=2316733 RepID=A0A3A8J9B0_9BACT|nr:hypothetical protein D7V88_14380 [Corallococcus terminator]